MIFKFVNGVLKMVGMLLFVLIITGIAFLYVSSINSTIEQGSAYELSIGMSQNEVFKRLPSAFKSVGIEKLNIPVKIEIYTQKDAPPQEIEVSLNDLEYSSLENARKWKFFVNSIYFFDNITLEFCNEKLCKIKRYRRYFELP